MRTPNETARMGAYYGAGLAAAAVLAAGAAYFYDPRSGRRRRAVRDQAHRLAHQGEEFVAKAGRDARQRAHGIYEQSVSRFRSAPPDDRVLEARMRAGLGRLCSHPGAIGISCSKGVARLRGHILESEMDHVLGGLRHVRGVHTLVNELQVHHEPGSISSLQGGAHARPLPRFEYLQENWAPAPRLLAGAAGTALIAGGLVRRSAAGFGMALLGAGLLGRSVANRSWAQLLGLHADAEQGVLVQKSICVHADVGETYACWRNLENFPHFMSHVREVRRLDGSRYRWRVDGPAGVPVEWNAVVTADVPGELIAWRTVEHAAIRSSGVVRFEPGNHGATRIHVRMSYRPPANVVGHTLAMIFGRDPKHQLDADLMRFKAYIETGRRARDSAAPVWQAGGPVGQSVAWTLMDPGSVDGTT